MKTYGKLCLARCNKTVNFHYADDCSTYKNFKTEQNVSAMDITHLFELSQQQCKIPNIMTFEHIGNLHRRDDGKNWNSCSYLYICILFFFLSK